MSYWNQSTSSDDRKEDKPPHSRVFVVCGKQTREEDLRPPFEQFGTIEDIYIPRDRNTGESKGVAYIKYTKTSSAAAAVQELHCSKILHKDSKPLKVMVAANKNDNNNANENRYTRLFIKVHKDANEGEIRQHFSAFGPVVSVHLQKDRLTDTNKGFAYVQYKNFLSAAKAFESCDKTYKPMFATPKDELKRSRNSIDVDSFHSSNSSISLRDNYHNPREDIKRDDITSLILSKPQNFNNINVICSPQVAQKHIEQLFNVVPGMKQCQYTLDTYNGICKATITYEDERAAAFAVERLNHYEFPSGEILTVKPNTNLLNKAATELSNIVSIFKNAVHAGTPDILQLADAIAEASSLIKVATTVKNDIRAEQQDPNYCNINLPPPQPMAENDSKVVQRCFIVCKPHPPPHATLKDVFCRFGDLIHVSTFPNKTFGFAKYASNRAAQEAIKTLNGAMVCGVKLMVVEADEKPIQEEGNKISVHYDQAHSTDSDIDRKRMRLIDKRGE